MVYGGWDEKEVETWQEIERAGFLRFVLVNGLLKWGGFMFVSFMIFNHFQRYGGLFSFIFNFDVELLVRNLVLWSVAGLLYGVSVWHWAMKSLHKHLRD